MSHKLPNYLRAYRKGVGFTQGEVASLLGCQSGAKVSRYERFARQPNLGTVFAYETIFRLPARELFAGIHQRAERATVRRVHVLTRRLSRRASTPASRRKADFLREVSLGLRADPQKPS